ncbi:MAG: hypothetical protein ABS36_12490 [Acidobacteria bacterium SCN 69-37]|nr:MAG: hypothetical protein ABS36_12490 [Acidobacteria bacterium SCN 69-37]
MVRLVHQLAAVALSLVLVGGNAAVCAGWAPTPEARMDCCADSDCPMHKSGASYSTEHTVTQAQADSCCAASEHENSSQSNPTFIVSISSAVLGTGVVLPATIPALVLSDGWRTAAPIPAPPVPKHVLLSVFLV